MEWYQVPLTFDYDREQELDDIIKDVVSWCEQWFGVRSQNWNYDTISVQKSIKDGVHIITYQFMFKHRIDMLKFGLTWNTKTVKIKYI